MKLQHLLILSLASLSIVGCVKELSYQQLNTNPLIASVATPVTLNQVQNFNQVAQSSDANNIKSGSFVSGEHKTQGTVRITTKNGKSFLSLGQSFKTSESGPDLVIVLHRSHNVISSTKPPSYPLKRGDYVVLAPLKKFQGSQTYQIPNNIKLSDYKSVAIWCRRFNATFGAASLSS